MRAKRSRIFIEGVFVLGFFALATVLLLGSYNQAVQAPYENATPGTPGVDGADVQAKSLAERASVLGWLGAIAALATVLFAVLFTRDTKRFVRLNQVRERQKESVRQAYQYLRGKMGPPSTNN